MNAALAVLQAELAGVRTDPYLLSVTAGLSVPSVPSVHCGVVGVRIDDTATDTVARVAPLPSRWRQSEDAGLTHVTLLWPPNEPGGYSLIVDGSAVAEGDELVVSLTRAVWHRPGVGADGSACGSDCRPILGKGAAVAV